MGATPFSAPLRRDHNGGSCWQAILVRQSLTAEPRISEFRASRDFGGGSMITSIYSGTTTVLPWGATLRLHWSGQQGTDANLLKEGANNIVYSEAIPCADA